MSTPRTYCYGLRHDLDVTLTFTGEPDPDDLALLIEYVRLHKSILEKRAGERDGRGTGE